MYRDMYKWYKYRTIAGYSIIEVLFQWTFSGYVPSGKLT